jgi:hypothetical protein
LDGRGTFGGFFRRIVTGEEQAVGELIAEHVSVGEGREAPAAIAMLPRHTITIKVTVGRALPADVARAQFDCPLYKLDASQIEANGCIVIQGKALNLVPDGFRGLKRAETIAYQLRSSSNGFRGSEAP